MSASAVDRPVGGSSSLTRVADLRLPVDRPRRGALVTSRLRRTAAVYAAVAAAGMVPALVDAGPTWTAFGLGLLAPGGGLVHSGAWVALAVTVLLFAVANVAWFGAGMIVAPPAVWLGAAAYAAATVGTGNDWAEVAVPAAMGAIVVAGSLAVRASHAAARRRGVERNRYLEAVEIRIDESPTGVGELDGDQLAHLRGLVDLALQPLESFEGFDVIDQFQTSAIRYQLNFAHYALALAQANHTPAFRGYMSAAQRRLVDKMLQRRVWRYWQLENAWGNFSLDPEPIVRDNIMLSGYLGLMVGMYEILTGDDHYDQPGSLTFRWNDQRTFAHDHTSIAEAVHRNFADSPWGMFPCEPNWIYSACNTFGMNTLISHDALHGTTMSASVMDAYLRSLNEEFLTLDGRTTAIRSSRLGLTIPSLTSTMADAGMALFNNSIAPDYSRRLWEIIRHEFLEVDQDGHLRMDMRGWDRLDVGNYRPSDVSPMAIVGAAAAEMGDAEIADAISRTLADRNPPTERDGVRWYDGVSTQANAMLAMRSVNRRDGLRDLARGTTRASRHDPVLAEVPYPECLVARAVAVGQGLDVVLRGSAPGSPTTVAFAGLQPGRRHDLTVDGVTQTLAADATGAATATVAIEARSELRLRTAS